MDALRGAMTPTGAPPRIRPMLLAGIGIALGLLVGALAHPLRAGILAGLTCAVITVVGGLVPARAAVRVAIGVGLLSAIFTCLAYAVVGHPWLAAIAMAVVAMATSLAAAVGKIGIIIGTFCSLVYILASVVVTTMHLAPDLSFPTAATRIVLGAAVGVAAVWTLTRRRPGAADTAGIPQSGNGPSGTPAPARAIGRSLVTWDRQARAGARRAIPLAVGMFAYQRAPTHNALWIFLAMAIVLMPTGKSPIDVAAARAASTLIGVVVFSVLSLVVPDRVLFWLGIAFLVVGMVYAPVLPLIAGSASAMGAVILVGAPSGAVATWAGHRLIDTAVGCAIALIALYGLWPSDRAMPVADAVP